MLVLPALEDRYSLKALFLVYTPMSTNDVTAPVSSCKAIGTTNMPWVVLQVPVWSGCKCEYYVPRKSFTLHSLTIFQHDNAYLKKVA